MWARLLWVIALVGLVFWWLRNRRLGSRATKQGQGAHRPKTKAKQVSQAAVACAHCGLIVPVAEAVTLPRLWTKVVSRERLHFCCQDHVERYQQSSKNSNKG